MNHIILTLITDNIFWIYLRLFWRRKWQPFPVFLPGKSHGQRGLEGMGSQKSQTQLNNWKSTLKNYFTPLCPNYIFTLFFFVVNFVIHIFTLNRMHFSSMLSLYEFVLSLLFSCLLSSSFLRFNKQFWVLTSISGKLLISLD